MKDSPAIAVLESAPQKSFKREIGAVEHTNQHHVDLVDSETIEFLKSWVPVDFKIGDWAYCTYCGKTPNCMDHVIPYSMLYPDRTGGSKPGMKTPACKQCNNILSNLFFDTFQGRAQYVASRLSRKYAKLIAVPPWTPPELKELSAGLKRFVKEKQTERIEVIERISWQKRPEFFQLLIDAQTEAKVRFPWNKDLLWFLSII